MLVSAMANWISLKHRHSALALLCIFLSSCQLGKAQNTPQTAAAAAGVLQNEYFPGTGGTGGSNDENPEYFPGTGGTGGSKEGYPEYFPGTGGTGALNEDHPDPDHFVTQALLCFNEKQIYSSCNEAYRLSESGDLHVPTEKTDEYCDSPCLSETHLVLNCIESLLSHFKFYNKASINDVRETIKAGCSYGLNRGDFNVAEHIQAENSSAHKNWSSSLLLYGLLLMIAMGCPFLL